MQTAPPLPASERWVLGIVALHLSFLPWALGDMHPWSQKISLALALAGMVAALAFRPPEVEPSAGARLLGFPIFWLGGLFILIIVVQALNPAWRDNINAYVWWMSPLPHIRWLPHGMVTPFAIASPWRCLMIDASAWLVVCTIWIGFRRRRSFRILFSLLAANGLALAILAVLERASDADKIFWSWTPPQSYFVSSFIYKNHAGAYFDLLFALCAGLAVYHYHRKRPQIGLSNPTPLFVVVAAALALVVFISVSRAATALMVFYVLALPLLLPPKPAGENPSRPLKRLLGTYAAFAAAFGLILFAAGPETVLDRMRALFTRGDHADTGLRLTAARATWDMFRASPIYGWGADGFRFCFPQFQQHYPSIWVEAEQNHSRLYWEHSHNDYAEFLAEFGLVGAALAAASLGWWARALIRSRYWRNACLRLLVPGLLLTLAHAFGDFPYHNPAILLTWCALLCASLRWSNLEPKEG